MPAAFLAGGQPQAERMSTLEAVRDFRLRVIVSTDLVTRRSEALLEYDSFQGNCSLQSGDEGAPAAAPATLHPKP